RFHRLDEPREIPPHVPIDRARLAHIPAVYAGRVVLDVPPRGAVVRHDADARSAGIRHVALVLTREDVQVRTARRRTACAREAPDALANSLAAAVRDVS